MSRLNEQALPSVIDHVDQPVDKLNGFLEIGGPEAVANFALADDPQYLLSHTKLRQWMNHANDYDKVVIRNMFLVLNGQNTAATSRFQNPKTLRVPSPAKEAARSTQRNFSTSFERRGKYSSHTSDLPIYISPTTIQIKAHSSVPVVRPTPKNSHLYTYESRGKYCRGSGSIRTPPPAYFGPINSLYAYESRGKFSGVAGRRSIHSPLATVQKRVSGNLPVDRPTHGSPIYIRYGSRDNGLPNGRPIHSPPVAVQKRVSSNLPVDRPTQTYPIRYERREKIDGLPDGRRPIHAPPRPTVQETVNVPGRVTKPTQTCPKSIPCNNDVGGRDEDANRILLNNSIPRVDGEKKGPEPQLDENQAVPAPDGRKASEKGHDQIYCKDYVHERSTFYRTNGPPFRSHYIIFPDWVSEKIGFQRMEAEAAANRQRRSL